MLLASKVVARILNWEGHRIDGLKTVIDILPNFFVILKDWGGIVPCPPPSSRLCLCLHHRCLILLFPLGEENVGRSVFDKNYYLALEFEKNIFHGYICSMQLKA